MSRLCPPHDQRPEQGNERKLLRGEGNVRQCATLSPDICSSTQRSYNDRTETRFTMNLSGARSRRWESEFLSIRHE